MHMMMVDEEVLHSVLLHPSKTLVTRLLNKYKYQVTCYICLLLRCVGVLGTH